MPLYKYDGFKKDGAPLSGIQESTSSQRLILELSKQGILVSNVAEYSDSKGKLQKFIFSSKKRSSRFMQDFFFQLSLLIKTGIPLVDSLRIIYKSTRKSSEKELIVNLINNVSEGKRFSEALKNYPAYFSPMYVNLVRAAEAVGNLSSVLSDISTYEEEKDKNMERLKSAAAYPLVISGIGLVVFIFMMTVIVPKIRKMYSSIGQELPGITKFIIGLSDFVRSYGILLVLTVLIATFTLRYLYSTNEKFSMYIDKRLFKVNILAYANLTRFIHVLSFQIREGLPLSDALKYAIDSISNAYLRKELLSVRQSVQEGIKFSVALRTKGIFPDLLPAAVATGESTGNMPELLDRVADFYSKSTRKFADIFLSLVGPLFIVMLGVMIVFMALGVMLPLFNFSAIIG